MLQQLCFSEMKSLHPMTAFENGFPMKAYGTNFIKLTWKHMALSKVARNL